MRVTTQTKATSLCAIFDDITRLIQEGTCLKMSIFRFSSGYISYLQSSSASPACAEFTGTAQSRVL